MPLPPGAVSIRPLGEEDLPEADRIFRLAFGTFLGFPDPSAFGGDSDYVRTRWRANPEGALAAVVGEKLVGSNFATRWGSVGFFGPLTVQPNLWNHGVAGKLIEATVKLFARWKLRHTGLFTFPQSPKHVGLYQKFGYWPRFLTPLLGKTVSSPPPKAVPAAYSALSESEQKRCLKDCQRLAGAIYPGLDLSGEIQSVHEQRLGDTVFLRNGKTLAGFAICHAGAGTEAGSGTCYIKFGAARTGKDFGRLLEACEAFAAGRGLARLLGGVNAARQEALEIVTGRGFRADHLQGVVMERFNKPGYNRPGVYVLDDWR